MPLENQRTEQPASPGESAPAAKAEPLHEQFRRRLFDERRESAPAEKPANEKLPTGQASEEEGEEEYEADDKAASAGQESYVDDEEEPGAEEPQPQALIVDDRQFTVEDIRQLIKARNEYDADYRRKTQVMARHRQEYESRSQEVEQMGKFFQNLAAVNVQELEKINPQTLDKDQFSVWRQQLMQAKAGQQQLESTIEEIRKSVRKNRDQMLDHQAGESAEILKGLDKRWSNEFYAKLRDFAVVTGRYTAKEFSDVTDWRSLEGLIALYDREEARKNVKQNRETQEPPTRRRQRVRQKRDNTGKFQSAEQAVRSSSNAKADGSLRSYFAARLEAERKTRS